MTMATASHTQTTVTVETFAKDLWEALRNELRKQLTGVIGPDDFDLQVPSWDDLPADKRHEKIQSVRSELLVPITRAGYEIRRRLSEK